jgi:hypothetical protein
MCRCKTILKVFFAYIVAVLEFRKKECIGIFHFWRVVSDITYMLNHAPQPCLTQFVFVNLLLNMVFLSYFSELHLELFLQSTL